MESPLFILLLFPLKELLMCNGVEKVILYLLNLSEYFGMTDIKTSLTLILIFARFFRSGSMEVIFQYGFRFPS